MKRIVFLLLFGLPWLSTYAQPIPPEFTLPDFPNVAGHEETFPTTRICHDFFGLLQTLNISTPNKINGQWNINGEIQACVDHLSQGTPNTSVVWVLSFPAGTYRLNDRVLIRNSNLIIKGAGAGQTIFRWLGNSPTPNGGPQDDYAFYVGASRTEGEEVRINGALGSTQITLPDADGSFGYDRVLLSCANPYNDTYTVQQNSRIVYGWGGDTYFIDEPLRHDFMADGNEAEMVIVDYPQFVGFECFTIDATDNSEFGQNKATSNLFGNFMFQFAYDCYVRGVESKMPVFQHVTIDNASNIEVSGCYFHEAHDYGTGGHGYGVNIMNGSNECLIENNIFRQLRHAMLVQRGANGNVIAYNYSRENGLFTSGGGYDDLIGHGNYAFRNLFEGNSVQEIAFDTWGDDHGPRNVVFRNQVRSSNIRVGWGGYNSAPQTCIVANRVAFCPHISGLNHTVYDNLITSGGCPLYGPNWNFSANGNSEAFNGRPSYIPAGDWPVFGPGGSNNLPAEARWNIGNYTAASTCQTCPSAAPLQVTSITNACVDYGSFIDPGSIILMISGGVPPYQQTT